MSDGSSSIHFDLRAGERLQFEGVSVEMVAKSGHVARLLVTAPRDVKVQKQRCESEVSARKAAPSMTK